jgi:6-phosphofructokinase 1
LALGIGKAAGATLTLIAEEFPEQTVAFAHICDIVEASIIKRRAMEQHFGVAVLAEGLIEKLEPREVQELQDVERDDHGHIRFAEVDLARKVKVELQGRLSQRGIRLTIVNKNIGYELRCADPIPFDAAYCRDLGFSAIKFLVQGGAEAMISVQGGHMVPLSFDQIREAGTGKTRVRMVNVNSEGYRVAREYMLRVESKDFEDPSWIDKMALAANMTAAEFLARFGYLRGK